MTRKDEQLETEQTIREEIQTAISQLKKKTGAAAARARVRYTNRGGHTATENGKHKDDDNGTTGGCCSIVKSSFTTTTTISGNTVASETAAAAAATTTITTKTTTCTNPSLLVTKQEDCHENDNIDGNDEEDEEEGQQQLVVLDVKASASSTNGGMTTTLNRYEMKAFTDTLSWNGCGEYLGILDLSGCIQELPTSTSTSSSSSSVHREQEHPSLLSAQELLLMPLLKDVLQLYVPHLYRLALGKCHLQDIHAKYIGVALQNNENGIRSLQELWLPGNGIGDAGIESIAYGVSHHGSLRRLNLGNNPKIGLKGCTALSDALQVNKSLEELFLGGCDLHDPEVATLAQGLQNNETLRVLYLEMNQISDVGCKSFANQCLAHNASLESLHLGLNMGISDFGVLALIHVLEQTNYRMESINLMQFNFVSQVNQTRIRQCLDHNLRYKQMFENATNLDIHELPLGIWPNVLRLLSTTTSHGRKQDLLFQLLKSKPNICRLRRERQHNKMPRFHRKRFRSTSDPDRDESVVKTTRFF